MKKCTCENTCETSIFYNIGLLLFNWMGFGFLASLYLNNNAECSWKEGLGSTESVSVFTYFLGTYFSIHVFTWYVVFNCLYDGVIDMGLQYLLPLFNLCYRNEIIIFAICEFAFGYWAARDILGGWCDLERIGDCIQNDTGEGDCQSWGISLFTRAAQGICVRLTSDYNDEYDVYIRKPSSMCLLTFRYMGHFIMTSLSTMFTYTVVFT